MILRDIFFDELEHDRVALLVHEVVLSVEVLALDAGALDALPQPRLHPSHLLILVLVTLHSVFDLVEGLLLAVEALDADGVEGVGEEVALYGVVQGRVSGERRTQVNFKQPRLQI